MGFARQDRVLIIKNNIMLKDLYKKVEESKKNEVKTSNVTLSRAMFISEHKNLIKVLRSGDKKLQEAEAAKQEEELKEETGETAGQEDDEDMADQTGAAESEPKQ